MQFGLRFKRLVKRENVPKLRLHDLRHAQSLRFRLVSI